MASSELHRHLTVHEDGFTLFCCFVPRLGHTHLPKNSQAAADSFQPSFGFSDNWPNQEMLFRSVACYLIWHLKRFREKHGGQILK